MLNFEGIHVTTITPFKSKTYELDLDGARENTRFLVESDVSSIVPLGTVGEFASLSRDERLKLAEVVLDQINGKKKTVVGVSHTSFVEVIDFAKHAKDCGADAVLLIPPYYFKDREEGLISYLKLISSKVDIGIVLYNVPGLSKINMTSTLLSKILDAVDGIVAIKDATKDLTQLADSIETVGRRVPVIAGAEELSYYGLLAGSPGATSGMANFAPDLVTEMFDSVKAGKHDRARSLFFDKMLKFRHLDVPSVLLGFPIQNVYIKEAMNFMGMPAGPVRPPLSPLSDERREELRRALHGLNLVPVKPRQKSD
ncbi:MAG: dihydrodipicolinate synthase family protein [Thaumarchaeota archaeon]|nr:dihydrodipicolinate synthase family protein [Nitrososphaerota archaeon]